MNRKQQRTLESVFARLLRANIDWQDIESLFIALGAEVNETPLTPRRVLAAIRRAQAMRGA